MELWGARWDLPPPQGGVTPGLFPGFSQRAPIMSVGPYSWMGVLKTLPRAPARSLLGSVLL